MGDTMKVTIEHTTKKVSLFKSVPAIALHVELSEEEKQTISRSGLSDYVFHEPPICRHFPEHMQGPMFFKSLLTRGPAYLYYNDLAAAHRDDDALRTSLNKAKQLIVEFSNPVRRKDSFEL